MQVEPASIPDVKILRPKRHGDPRGFFSETWSRRTFEAAGIVAEWVQDNHAASAERGVVRGLHCQIGPAAQTKLVRVTRGSIFDVAVDLRRGSPTYGRHATAILSADAWNQIFVPKGFAHGYCTLEPETEVVYKVDAYYAPEHDRGVFWNDPALGIPWPIAPEAALLSEKDRGLPRFADLPALFP
ncbi:MAG TPA: dTDP-4-dehydrorhamnose 3,5-epimerase [Planctomycetota bacterium]|nr:dTDP-4-dehydrorhamnose 3,5-epimerase [Planctomycetota bacterium]